jgi:hypothetical protein
MQEAAAILDAPPPAIFRNKGRRLQLQVGERPPIAQARRRDLNNGHSADRLGQRGNDLRLVLSDGGFQVGRKAAGIRGNQ